MYRTQLQGREEPGILTIKGLRDRAQIFFTPIQAVAGDTADTLTAHGRSDNMATPDTANRTYTLHNSAASSAKNPAIPQGNTARQYLGTLYRNDTEPLSITVLKESGILEILVENMGRINYGAEMFDAKGITKGVYLDYQNLFNWEHFPLPLTTLAQLTACKPLDQQWQTAVTSSHNEIPAFYRFTFMLENTGDSFIDIGGWTKGGIFVNDTNIGRYWHIGPQKRFYIRAPLLRRGENTIIVFELHGTQQHRIYLSAEPDLGEPEHE